MPTANTLTTDNRFSDTNNNRIVGFFDGVIYLCLLVLVFILPLAANPLNNESLETTKFFLLLFFFSLTIILWSVRGIFAKKLQFNLSFLHLPLLLFVFSLIFSSVFSLNRFYSLWGQQGIWHLNLAQIILAFLFSLITATIVSSHQKLKALIIVFLLSLGIVSLITLITFSPWVKNGLILTGSASSLLLLSLISFFGNFIYLFSFWKKGEIRNPLTPLLVILLGVSLTTIIYLSSGFLAQNPLKGPTDLQLDRSTSWIVTTNVLQNYPLLGTGPGTFNIDFNRFKPASFNLTPFWGLTFFKADSEALTLLSTTGLLGLGSFLLLAFLLTKNIIKQRLLKPTTEDWLLGLPIISLLLSVFFINFTLTTFFVFLLFFSLYLANKNLQGETEITSSRILSFSAIREYLSKTMGSDQLIRDDSRFELMPYVFALFGFGLVLVFGFNLGKFYLSQNHFLQSQKYLQENKNDLAISELSQAINLTPDLDAYRVQISQLYLIQANKLSSQKTLSDQEKSLLQNYLSLAVNQIKLATEKLNPYSSSDWGTQARIYQSLAGILPENAKADDPNIKSQLDVINLTINAYNQAIALDPNNAQLQLDLGGLFFSQRSYPAAEKYFTQAINLKPNLANAYYNLAYALKNQNKNQEAAQSLQNVLLLLPKDSEDYKKTQKELEEIQKLLPTPTSTPAAKISPAASPTPSK